MKTNIQYLIIGTFYVCLATGASAEDSINYKDNTLTGDWGGTRTSLANGGVNIDAVYKFDIMANVSGGIKKDTRGLDNLDVLFSFDGEKLFGSKGTTALIHALNNNGGKPDGSLVGSAQGIDNIEVPRATAKLYQAWVQQNLYDDKLSVLGGLYDLNSEFYVNEASALFIHSTYGIGTDIAQSGLNGPSIFPFTSLAARVKIQPTPNYYAQVAILDGVSGDPNNLRGTQIELNNGDGALWVGEAGHIPGGAKPNGKIAVGGWYYTSRFPDLVNADKKHNQGIYFIGERKIYHEAGSDTKGLDIFGRIGFADKNVNQFDYAWSAGLVYTGLISGRDDGKLGLGIAGAHNSSKYKQVSAPVDNAEIAIELTYNDTLTPWLAVQPDIQYIVNPGTDPALDNALVFGSRFIVNF